MKAIRLRTEYLTNPMGIGFTRPRLSWNCDGEGMQKAYRILAQRELTDGSMETVWDTKKVESDQMHLIEWGASPLKSRDRIVWKVMLWGETDGKADDASKAGSEQGAEPEWSEPAYFELGLISGVDFRASWITGDYKVDKKKRYPVDCFRKNFCTIKSSDGYKKITRARAYMTACGIYEGQMNGTKMGDFCLAPGITDYRKRIQLQTADITDLVKEGENRVTFMLADGWYRGSVGAWAMKNYYGSETKIYAQIEINYEDGSTQYVVTDESFEWNNEGPIRFADNKDGEIYDARLEDSVFASNDGWGKCKLTSCDVLPQLSNNFELKEHERLTEPRLIITPSGKKVLDFGQNIAGYIEFTLPEGSVKAGDRLFLRFGELIRDGEFTQTNIQCSNKKITTPLQQVEYFAKDGENHYKTRFAIFGFQYVLVEGDIANLLGSAIKPDDFTAIAVYSDFETTFTFDSSNELLNKFVQSTLWSLKNNSADLPTDCPTRERHGWTGDAQLFVNTASYMVNYAPFAQKFENDMCDWQTPDGKFPQIAPEGGTDAYMRSMNGSVAWADAGVMIPYRLWKKFDDISIIKRYYEPMKKYAHFMMKRCGKTQFMMSEKTGLKGEDKKYLYNVGQHYGEWAEPADVHAMSFKDFMSSNTECATAYCSYVMSLMVEIAEALGKTEDIPVYREYRDGCKRTYQKLVKQPGYELDTDRQAKLVRPLYFGLLDEEQTAYAKDRLIRALDNYGWRIGTGFCSTPLILYVLQEIGIEYAYKLLENEENPGWLVMPKTGANTIWEDWNGPNSDNGGSGGIASLDHYSKGACCEWVFDTMCGVRVDGKNHFVITPHPGGHFEYASFTYDSVYGTVSVRWTKKDDGTYDYDIKLPANTTAEIELV